MTFGKCLWALGAMMEEECNKVSSSTCSQNFYKIGDFTLPAFCAKGRGWRVADGKVPQEADFSCNAILPAILRSEPLEKPREKSLKKEFFLSAPPAILYL